MVPFFKAKYPGGDYVFECNLATSHYRLAFTNILGESGIPYISSNTKPTGMVHKYGPRRFFFVV